MAIKASMGCMLVHKDHLTPFATMSQKRDKIFMLVTEKSRDLFPELRDSLSMLRIKTLNSDRASALRVTQFSFINFPKSTTSNIVLIVKVVGG
ncbi:hypothetical protein HanHA300_Chr15g0579021 [Helianthus annuus]|nr:hypothetical protein HanHA300_Chr15g0579021 [Helianthus annuus]KAJ0649912.1 hypothetical protein HanLR1_Chr15g0589641 [Helianthus annuus]KAJ0653700.1 hypothetical protein HanOQP8_Chr15g0586451 [Helianthus annuus]KAJ0832695.1 hypothetical protein HanPSC8_Chr15g0681591 [Helianthus annuus]